MKKFIAGLTSMLLAAVLLLVCTACGPGASPEDETTTEEPVSKLGIMADEIKVGIIHIASTQDISGYTYAHHTGFMSMVEILGLKESQYVIKDKVDDQDIAAAQKALQELVDAGCDVIFATSYQYMDAMEEYAARYPKVIFSHCSGYKSNGTNFNNYFGRIYEARYLAGIAAGLKMKQADKPLAGYVAAMDTANSEVTGGLNAWALGIQSVYPEAEVKVKVIGSWHDPEGEAAAAKELIDAGCYVIGQHCDTEGPQTTAQAHGAFGCGYNSDMSKSAPKAHLAAPIWNWGAYYLVAVQNLIDGTWDGSDYFLGLEAGLVDISPINTEATAPGTEKAVGEARNRIAEGELVVFPRGLVKADGTKIHHALTDREIKGEIDYYVKGVSLL